MSVKLCRDSLGLLFCFAFHKNHMRLIPYWKHFVLQAKNCQYFTQISWDRNSGFSFQPKVNAIKYRHIKSQVGYLVGKTQTQIIKKWNHYALLFCTYRCKTKLTILKSVSGYASLQTLRTRIVVDLAGRLTPTAFKVSSLQIVNDWKANEQKTSDFISISNLQVYSFKM